MKNNICLIVFLCCAFFSVNGSLYQLMAQNTEQVPLINLTVSNKPLGDILETISGETGYTFDLEDEWKNHPITTSISKLPLEKGLKRLLRSLNHTIIWDSDRTVTIKIFGKVDSKMSSNAGPPPMPPRTNYRAKTVPVVNQDIPPADQSEPTIDNPGEEQEVNSEGDTADPETGDEQSTPPEENPDETPEQQSPETDQSTEDTTG